MNRRRSRFVSISSLLLSLLLCCGTTAWSKPAHSPPRTTPSARSTPLPTTLPATDAAADVAAKLGRRLTPAEIIRACAPAVVAIVAEVPGEGRARGTGFFANPQGLVVTSNHLVTGASSLRIKTHKGRQFTDVKVLLSRHDVDLAVLQIVGLDEAEPFLHLGNSDQVTVGERVVTIGHPMGLEYTVSDGLVSAVRETDTDGLKLIQFSAAASPGSSGGPVINESGQVIGIVSMSHPEGQSLNFAVPINLARVALASLSQDGHVVAAAPAAATAATAAATRAQPANPAVAIPAGVDLVPSTPVVKVQAPLPRQVFKQGNRGFEMACPEAWQLHSFKEHDGVMVTLTSPDGLIRFDFASVAVAGSTTLSQFASDIMRAVRAVMASRTPGELAPLRESSPHLVREANTRVAGLDWKLFVYSNPDGDGNDQYIVTMMALQNSQGYVVRYSVPVREWTRARDIVQEVVEGVTIF